MKKIVITTLLLISTIVIYGQLRTPAQSPRAAFSQTIGLTDVEVSYYRPSAREREIFADDGLVPYGQYWRTGANGATKLKIEDDIVIAGQKVTKGDYAVLTKPGRSSWEVLLYSYETTSWSSYTKKTPDYILPAQSMRVQDYVETFAISIENIGLDRADLVFSWADTRAALPIEVEVKERTMKAIDRVLEEPSLNDYFSAGSFIHTVGGDLDRALRYVQKVTKSGKGRFFHFNREARILRDLGRNAEAITAAQKSLDLAREAGNADFVKLNEQLIAELKK